MKHLFSTLLVLLAIITLEAQDLNKGFKFYKQHRYADADEIFKKALKNKKDVEVALYGRSLILTDTNYVNENFRMALRNCEKIKKLLAKQSPKVLAQYKKKYNFDQTKVDSLIDLIYRITYLSVKRTRDSYAYDDYLLYFPNTPYYNIAEYERDSLIFVEEVIYKGDNLQAYEDYFKNYPESKFKTRAKEIYLQKLKNLYDNYYKSLNYSKILDFEKKYKSFADTIDSTNIYRFWAKQLYDLQLERNYIDSLNGSYQKFIRTCPFQKIALKVLYTLAYADTTIAGQIDTLKKYRNIFKNNLAYEVDAEIKMLKSPVGRLQKIVNTKYNEYFPVISTDGKTLYFCSDNRPDGIGREDVFVTRFKNGHWTKPKLAKAFSDPWSNDAILTVSADGNRVLLFRDGAIYKCHKTKNGWSKPVEFSDLNGSSWNADACYTADGKALLFASNRREKSGLAFQKNTDIYVVLKINDSTWSKPINLGKTINTDKVDRTPFLHPDMKTLYFSSERNDSYGGLDVYKSVRLSDTSWTQWSKPINLGPLINTRADDYGFKITTDGQFAIYSSDIKNYGSNIIVQPLPDSVKPDIVVLVTGIVTDENNNPLDAKVIWENLDNGKKLGELTSDPKDGKFLIPLPVGKNYGFYVAKDGYYPVSDNIDLTHKPDTTHIYRNFVMVKIAEIESGDFVITLKNVFFDFNKYTLKKESYPELMRLVRFLLTHPNLKIEISGHTDNIGSTEYNKKLSQKRAEAIRNFLIEHGCNPDNMVAVGYGESKPIATNETDEGRAKNRRVEIKVLNYKK